MVGGLWISIQIGNRIYARALYNIALTPLFQEYKLYIYINKTINMKAQQLKRGMKVKNQHGKELTVLEVIGGLMVRTYEDFNNLYHCTKLHHKGVQISA